MKVVEEYQERIRKAATLDDKKAFAAELHRLSDTFNESQQEEYQSAMAAIRTDIADKLGALRPYVQRAEALLHASNPAFLNLNQRVYRTLCDDFLYVCSCWGQH